MKVITVNEPKFIAEFQCVGGECIEHCCQGWSIVMDKTSVNKYLKSPIIEIKNIAINSLNVIKKNHAQWAVAKLNEHKVCGFMDEHKLCKVHALMGASALSPTCANYPRTRQVFKSEENNTLVLSCPEAARLLLTSDDAMQMATHEQLRTKWNTATQVNQRDKLINLISLHLLNASQAETAQGLYAIASLLLLAEKDPHNVEAIETYFGNLLTSIEHGEIAQQIDEIESNHQLQWSLLLRLQTYLASRKPVRSLGRLKFYVARLLQVQTNEIKDNQVGDNMRRLEHSWSTIVQPWLNERPYIMRNYMMYRVYSSQFPDSRERQPLSWLYFLTAEWFLIKSMIAATAEIDGKISEKEVIDIIYSFHGVTKHDDATKKVFLAQIDEVKINDDLSLLYLLK